MDKRYVLGVDLGTTAIKVGLFDEKGQKVRTATQEYQLLTPQALWVEQTPQTYWDSFKAALANVLDHCNVDRNKIEALSVSAQGETLVFLDKRGEPLYNFIVWMDNRAQEESEMLMEAFDQKTLHKATGQTCMVPLSPAPKTLWFKRNYPERFEKIDKILLIEDYFFWRMGGGFYGEGSLWCTSFMWDINTHGWWRPMVDYLGLSIDQLPELVESGTPIGTILPHIAKELGLPETLKLVMGGLDQACGAIGVGNVAPGIFSESTGAALVVCTMTDHIIFDETGELSCFYSAIPGQYMIHAYGSGGIAYKWLRDALCSEESAIEVRGGPSAYQLMDEQAKKAPAGSEGLVVLPHFQGAGPPDTNQYAKCMMYGLGLQHTKAHVIRSFMEGVAMTVCRMVGASEELMGEPVKEIRSLSGGAKSELWCQIKADALGKPVVTMKNTQDAACLGAALIAGVAAGIWPSVAEAALEIVRLDKTFQPKAENKPAYEDLMKKYLLLTGALNELAQQL